jgi:hypothetical protein
MDVDSAKKANGNPSSSPFRPKFEWWNFRLCIAFTNALFKPYWLPPQTEAAHLGFWKFGVKTRIHSEHSFEVYADEFHLPKADTLNINQSRTPRLNASVMMQYKKQVSQRGKRGEVV